LKKKKEQKKNQLSARREKGVRNINKMSAFRRRTKAKRKTMVGTVMLSREKKQETRKGHITVHATEG